MPDFDDPLHYLSRGITKLHSIWVCTTYPFCALGRGVSIHQTCQLFRPSARFIKLGNGVVISKDVWLNVSRSLDGDKQPAILIDDDVSVGRRSQISAANCIHLERDVTLAAGVLLLDHNHAYQDVSLPVRDQGITAGGSIRVGQGSFIGQGAAIVCEKGELILGQNCVVAANALVTRSFPAYSVIAGNPARLIKHFDPSNGRWALGAVTANSKTARQPASEESASAEDCSIHR